MRFKALTLSSLTLAVCWASFCSGAQEQAPEATHDNTITPTISTEKGLLPLDELRTFTRVFEDIRSGYVEEVDDATLLEYAIKGMLNELDPHSSYLNADNFDNLKESTSGKYGGLGIEVGMEDGFVKVIAPMDGTPAEKAGIESGDLIIQIDGESVKGKSLNDAIKLMRGEKDSPIKLKVVRQGKDKPIDITLVRDFIKIKSVRSRIIDDNLGFIRIAQFQLPTGDDFVKEIEKLQSKAKPLQGLIVDLRNNPGGVLRSSVKVADTLLDGGRVVYTEGRIKGSNTQYDAQPGDISDGLPLVVLINGGSASASEIVAGALQDHSRGLIMGTESFGKGSVQTVVPLADGSAVKLTTALYFTPNGRSIQAQGIEPDVLVPSVTLVDKEAEFFVKEAELSGHLKNGTGGKDRTSTDVNVSINALAYDDFQLYQAYTVLTAFPQLLKRQR